jgi:hypothetical protein
MKSVKTLAMGAVVALSLVGVSSASAANWDPQNTNVGATQEGHGILTTTGGSSLTCSTGTTILRAVGAVASTTAAHNPVAIGGCSSSLGGASSVTTFGTWTFTAVSTTNVHILAHNSAGPNVAVISIPGLGCSINVPSPVTIPNNTWSNANHTLHINNAAEFGLSGSGLCAAAGTGGFLDANFVVPLATIT